MFAALALVALAGLTRNCLSSTSAPVLLAMAAVMALR